MFNKIKMLQKPKKLLFLSIFLVVLLCYLIIPKTDTFSWVYYYFNPLESIQCFHEKGTNLPEITDINPQSGRSIFFHETSCSSYYNGKIVINARQACAVESAARQTPNYEVYLLYASPAFLNFQNSESDRFLQALLTYPNIKILHLDFEEYTRHTPLEELYRNGKIDKSGYAKSHASDILRYLTLWKYGGIYLDLDVVVIKNLEELGINYAGIESNTNVAAGVMNFSPAGVGHELARKCLEDLRHNFKGHDWGNNGPGVITRLLQGLCKEKKAKNMINKECGGFKVYPPEYFYPIPWWKWPMYFEENSTNEVMKRTSSSYVIHVWNKHSVSTKVPKQSKIPYLEFAQKYCPKVFKEIDCYL